MGEEEKIEKLAQLTGLDADLIKDLGAEDLAQDKMEFLEKVFSLYLSDSEGFSNFLVQSGINNILNNIDSNETEDLNQIMNNISQAIKDEDVDLDL